MPPVEERLDSWKAIACYLKRDLATARRWEKRLGLPVYRVGGGGRSVFAYTGEIDAWLRKPKPLAPELTGASAAVAIDPIRNLPGSWLWRVFRTRG